MENTIETKPLNIEDVDFADNEAMAAFNEALMAPGVAKVQDDMRRLREMGLIDEQGNQLKSFVHPDMLDPDADFGGCPNFACLLHG